jgi:hypothetical protein
MMYLPCGKNDYRIPYSRGEHRSPQANITAEQYHPANPNITA